METKLCKTCGQVKPVTEFFASPRGMPGYRPGCKACRKIQRREAYLRLGGKDVPYEQVLKREYGITLADYNKLLRSQAHRCAICRRPETVKSRSGEPRRLSVDHDHVTKTV
ncbi:MAG: endonuclease domain-containing protein, partial [Micromonosporaceae bacterium]